MDQQLVCIDCNQPFTFTQGEQEFYAGHNLTEPKRCKPCRDAKKRRQAQGGVRAPRPPRPAEVSHVEDGGEVGEIDGGQLY